MKILTILTSFWVFLGGAYGGTVHPGADFFLKKLPPRSRVALVGNHTSQTSSGEHLIDLLSQSKEVELVKIFTPEHGLSGRVDEAISDSIDQKTGLPILSLYGKKRAPLKSDLEDVDLLIFDIQDVGLRYYTFGTTLALVMKAAKEAGIPVWILDRPNPLGGELVDGLILDSTLVGGFASYYPIITSHGMTIGEYARFINEEFHIGVTLNVVLMQGWNRTLWFDETGLTWTPPSPALPSVDQTLLYTVLGSLEATNLSAGRGTSGRDFSVYGAPWISSEEATTLVEDLNRLKLPGVLFEPVQFQPSRSAYQGENCNGFGVKLLNRKDVKPFYTLLRVSSEMMKLFGARFKIEKMSLMVGSAQGLSAFSKSKDWQPLYQKSLESIKRFRNLRAPYLLY